MPFDPRKIYKLSLDCYKDIPEPERPLFFYRRINGAEYLDISRVTEAEGKPFREQGEAVYNALQIGLTGWQNQTNPATEEAIEFDPARLAEIIDPIDAMDLVNKRMFSARLSGDELKNLKSQF